MPRVRLDDAVGRVGERERSRRSSAALLDVGRGQSVERADEVDVLPTGEQLVDRGGLAGQAHAAAHRVGLAQHVVAVDPGGAARGPGQGGHHAHGRRLAGAVGAQESENGASRDREAHTLHCDRVAEVLDQVVGLDGQEEVMGSSVGRGSDSPQRVFRPSSAPVRGRTGGPLGRGRHGSCRSRRAGGRARSPPASSTAGSASSMSAHVEVEVEVLAAADPPARSAPGSRPPLEGTSPGWSAPPGPRTSTQSSSADSISQPRMRA